MAGSARRRTLSLVLSIAAAPVCAGEAARAEPARVADGSHGAAPIQLAQDVIWKGSRPIFKSDKKGGAGDKKGGAGGKKPDGARAGDGAGSDKSPQEIVRALDKDGDGRIGRGEWQGKVPFDVVDTNKDGYVTAEEIAEQRVRAASKQAGASPSQAEGSPQDRSPEEIVRALDKDGDGRVSRAEWRGRIAFDTVDADGDGYVTAAEIAAARARQANKQAAQSASASPADKSPEEIVRALDKDGDGRVSRAEWKGDVDFDSVDADKDGYVTAEEIRARRAEVAARKQAKAPGAGD